MKTILLGYLPKHLRPPPLFMMEQGASPDRTKWFRSGSVSHEHAVISVGRRSVRRIPLACIVALGAVALREQPLGEVRLILHAP